MESALDVLSRAASMVENNDYQRENALRRDLDSPPPPATSLVPATSNLKREREPAELVDDTSNTKKCAGTQTAFTIFNTTNGHQQHPHHQSATRPTSLVHPYSLVQNQRTSPPPVSSNTRARHSNSPPHHNVPLGSSNHNVLRGSSNHNAPGVYRTRSSSSSPPTSSSNNTSHHHPYARQQQQQQLSSTNPRSLLLRVSPSRLSPPPPTEASHNMPLNLSVSANAAAANARVGTTVITQTSGGGAYGNNTGYSSRTSTPEMNNNTPTEVEDPAIEEHFRRSLGQQYDDMVRHRSSSRSPASSLAASPPTSPTVSMTFSMLPTRSAGQSRLAAAAESGSRSSPGVSANQSVRITDPSTVDDHFAKSLGLTWYQLKAKEEMVPDPHLSVDDHFAKALGNTWFRIKAEKEGGAGGSSSSSSTGSSSPSTPTAPQPFPSTTRVSR